MRKFLILIIPLCFGCVSKHLATEPSEIFQCPSGEFQGSGFGETEREALGMAHDELAKQISLSIKITVESTTKQQVLNGEENLSSEYLSKTEMESSLSNAHDARIGYKKRNGDRINMAVCMSRADAAKGFKQRQKQISDSLEFVASAWQSSTRPDKKNEAWRKAQSLWLNMPDLTRWGMENEIGRSEEIYEGIKNSYMGWCRNHKTYWQSVNTQETSIIFSHLSRKIKMEQSECKNNGIKLVLNNGESNCYKIAVGTECSFEPSLSVYSCTGEKYSELKTSKAITGFNMDKKNLALQKLYENLSADSFLDDWEKELLLWACE